MALRSLEDFNKSREGAYMQAQQAMSQARPNGIACPDCGKELMDTNPYETLCSNPPKKRIACSCGYHGYRIA